MAGDPTQRESEILCCQGNVWQQAGGGAEHFRFVEESHQAVSVFCAMKVMYMRLSLNYDLFYQQKQVYFNGLLNY